MTTPTIREVVDAAMTVNASWTVDTSSAVAAGDVFAVFHFWNGNQSVGMVAPTSPALTWTLRQTATEPTWQPAIKLWTATAVSGGVHTLTFPSPGIGNLLQTAALYVLQNALEAPEAATETQGDSTSNHTVPSATATSSDALALGAVGTRGGSSGAYTWPTSTERTDRFAGAGSTGGVFSTASRVLASAGATGTENLTGTAVSGWGEFVSMRAIFGGSGGGTPASSLLVPRRASRGLIMR